MGTDGDGRPIASSHMSVSRSRKPPLRLLRVSHATFASQSISTSPSPSALARTMAYHVLLLSSALLLPSRPPLRVETTRRAPSRACVLSIAERERAVATLAIVRPAELEEAECELNHLDFCDMENGRIVLLRHGESEWNAGLPRFTGWSDVGLSARGVEQAAAAGRILLDHEVCFEQVHVSNLKRTIKTAWTVLEAMDTFTVPIVQSWRLNERMYGALTGLDKVATEADAALIAVHRDVTSHRKTNFLATTTNEIARNRLFVSERYDPFAQEYTSPRPEERKALIQYSRQRHRTKSSWSIADSCWAPRARDGNSKDFLETDEALSRMFRVDWEFALRGHGLERLIIENDDESGMWRDADGNNVHDEIDEVADVLDRYRRVIYGAFEYYCCIFAEDELQSLGHVRREADVFNMPRAAYDGFVEECKLVGKGLSLQEHAALFAQINAVEFEMAVRDRHNPRGCLCRHEFIQALVRIAIAKYVLSGKITDASDAVESLLTADIASNLPERALQNSNTFRTRYCYTEKTDEVLSKHMALLRRLYKHYSQAYQAEHSRLSSAELMSVGEWMALLDHLGLFATDQLTAEQGRLIFMWSRIRSIEDYLDESEISLRHMSFEDFMEAVVRVATLIALPSDDEVKEARVRDGGEFLINLQDSAPNEFRNFVTSRRHEWDQPPTQSVGRCVDHFLCYIIWVIECSVGSRVPVGEKRTQLIFDGVIDSAEVAKFIQDGGRSAHGRAAEEAANPTAVADRAVLLQALRRFHVTSSLGDTKLQRVADKMTVRRWEQGDCVFRQGEEADAFYVLIEGEAEVMRQDGERGEEKIIKTLKEGHPFGERALWTDEPRYAGVRVRTWPCKTMAISSADFERAIGPLKRYVKNLDSMGDTLAPVRVVIEPAELSEGRAFRGHPQRASCRDRAF